jgi:hypothetical protein
VQLAAINSELIVSEIYDSITLEYNGKFEKIEELFSILKSQIDILVLRVATMEKSVKIMNRSVYLIFFFLFFFFF